MANPYQVVKQHGNTGKGIKDIVGQRFGKLIVLSRLPASKDRRTRWKCVCDCGNETIARGESLKLSHKRSCGCLHRRSHGEASRRKKKPSAEYRTWNGMIRRCTNKNEKSWHRYGGRGITICDRWRHSYPNFLADVGRRPSDKHSLDRIDVNGNYEPGNVRWATASQQMKNRRPYQYKGWRESTKHAWAIVRDFERVIASYTGSPYAVAVDSCTNALLLAVAYHIKDERGRQSVEIPKFTYVGVPMSVRNAGAKVLFRDEAWVGQYQLKPYPIYDSARHFTSGMYIPGTMMCLSFQWTKHLPIGHGGMILCDNKEAVTWLKRARFDGRTEGVAPKSDKFLQIGWHVVMSPVSAAQGLLLMGGMREHNEPLPWGVGTNSDYPDLSQYKIFQ